MGCTKIRRELLDNDDINVSRQSISKLVNRYEKTGSYACKPKPGKQSTFRKEYLDFIDEEMEKDDELTAPKLQRMIAEKFGANYSLTSIKQMRRKLGWVRTGPKYCQLNREANQIIRLDFAQQCLERNDNFDDVIFTDESSTWMERHGKLCFQKINKPPKLKPTPKHPYKVHVSVEFQNEVRQTW